MIIIHDYQSHVAHDAVGDGDDYDDYDFMIMNPGIHDGDVFAKSELKLITFSLQVSANSDGNLEPIGPAGELWVQCGLPSRVKKSSPLFALSKRLLRIMYVHHVLQCQTAHPLQH